jgi:hypothetical protein
VAISGALATCRVAMMTVVELLLPAYHIKLIHTPQTFYKVTQMNALCCWQISQHLDIHCLPDYLLRAECKLQYVSSLNNDQKVYDTAVNDQINGDDNFGIDPCCSSLNKHIMV